MLYILKSTLILGIVLSIYYLFMEREKMHRVNRLYLISGLVLAFMTPLITVGSIDTVPITSMIAVAPTLINEVQTEIILETAKGIDWLQFIIYGYAVITLIMLLRFINNIVILLIKAANNPIINHKGHKVVLLPEATLPHTFLNYIFINQTDFESEEIEDELFIHEFTHADQWHSIDIILVELIHVLFWFNPLVYFYKKAIQLNHEFLADEAVVKLIKEIPAYQNMLLEKASNTDQVYMASNLNFGVTKKRLLMMTKPISMRRNVVYGLMIIPMMVGLVSCFGDYRETATVSNALIDYVTKDQFSVNFIGMTQEQLNEVQWKLANEGIDVEFDDITFDSSQNSTLDHLGLRVNFNNGSTMKTEVTCSSIAGPYGIWFNRTTGAYGAGFLNTSADLTTDSYLPAVIDYIGTASDFFIESKRISQEQALSLLEDRSLRYSYKAHIDHINQTITFKSINKNEEEQLKPDSKSSTLNRMKELNKSGANFIIGNNNVSYEAAVAWMNKTTYWQVNMHLEDKETGKWIVQLESSISFNPFKKIESMIEGWMTLDILSKLKKSETNIKEGPTVKEFIDFQFPSPKIHFEDKLISMEKLVEYSYIHEDLCVSGTKNNDGTSDVYITL